MVLAIVLAGFVIGLALGKVLGSLFTGLYPEAFRFPSFPHGIAPWLVVAALALTVLTAVVGTLQAITTTVRMAPAEAMRPPAPAHYRRTLAERLGIRGLSTGLRMVLRNMERRPLRSVRCPSAAWQRRWPSW